MQHYFYVASYITGTQYLHVRHPGKDISIRTHVLNSYFVIHNKNDAHAQNSHSSFLDISAVSV